MGEDQERQNIATIHKQREHYTKVFRDNEKLKEMLSLRLSGWSYPRLAARYSVDHTSVIYQCQKHIPKEVLEAVQTDRVIDIEKIRIRNRKRKFHWIDVVPYKGQAMPYQEEAFSHRRNAIFYDKINPGKKYYKQYLQEYEKQIGRRVKIYK